MIIGLSGFASSGKSTVAEYLQHVHGFHRLSFAGALKDITAITFGWDRQKLQGATPEDREWRETPDEYWTARMGRPFSPRYALQFLGTEVFRNTLSKNIWVDILVQKIHTLRAENPYVDVVVEDTRFRNERKALRELGAIFINIRRPEVETPFHQQLWKAVMDQTPLREEDIPLHRSEWEWMTEMNDLGTITVNDADITRLQEEIRHIIDEQK